MADRVPLVYSIHGWSSYAGEFTPEHILENKPSDQKSRWLSDGSRPPQYLTLRLDQLAIVCSIQFGKYEKSHACNLRKFTVHGGMDCEHMHLLLEGGLANDSEPETFSLQHEVEGKPVPFQYIKISPLQSWGPSFSFSVWFVELRGVVEEGRVKEALSWYEEYREREAMRLCLKHLRQFDYTEAFNMLQKKAKVQLEHPLLTQLHSLLVEKGDFVASERVLEQATEEGFLDDYISQQPLEARWTLLESKMTDGEQGVRPGMRGGHQMCIDPIRELLYLYGGWDGSHDLGDLWQFDVRQSHWTCLCQDTSLVGGPPPCSCHKMCLDVEGQLLYVLGRYLDPASRAQLGDSTHSLTIPNTFYSYCIDTNTWTLISSDTYADGGPQLIYDHQMCFASFSQTLYVFGGRVLTVNYVGDTFTYSGLYAYHCSDRQWTCLRPDYSGGFYPHDLTPRMAHTMLFHPGRHQLIVMGGQRDKQPLSDMVTYDVLSDETTVVADGKDSHIPASGFTMRTTIDPSRNEIYFLTGLNKFDDGDSHGGDKKNTSNSLWLHNMDTNKWACILQGVSGAWQRAQSRFPIPRYAHQFIFDPVHQVHYMFGGNPGNEQLRNQQKMRLDDFWRLKLVRQSKEQLLRHCQFIIRKQRFDELAVQDPVAALSYLQTTIAAIVNHDNNEESTEFRRLTSILFTSTHPPALSSEEMASLTSRNRNKLYNELASYFPEHMTQPRENIVDMIKL